MEMAYTKIAGIGEGTTTQTMVNPCNIQTLDNIIMLCDDIELANYTMNNAFFKLSDSSMYPGSDLKIPVFITDKSVIPNVYYILPLKIDTQGELSLPSSFGTATVHTNGLCFHINSKYYNQTIGNTDPSLFTSPLSGV